MSQPVRPASVHSFAAAKSRCAAAPAGRAAPRPEATPHERIGFELGWDYAHHRVALPAPYSSEPSPLRDGWFAGRAAFGARALAPTRYVRKWLQLRLHAWLRGRSVELIQVTPHYLQQIDVSHCPITRLPLSSATMEGSTLGRTSESMMRMRPKPAMRAFST